MPTISATSFLTRFFSVIDTGAACVGATPATPDMKYISASDVVDNGFCVSGKTYILMGASGDPEYCPIVNKQIQCTPNDFKPLPGILEITGGKDFGGVNASSIVTR